MFLYFSMRIDVDNGSNNNVIIIRKPIRKIECLWREGKRYVIQEKLNFEGGFCGYNYFTTIATVSYVRNNSKIKEDLRSVSLT